MGMSANKKIMGSILPTCNFCGQKESEDNPLLLVCSRGKRGGQMICFLCIKAKIKRLQVFERRINRKISFIEEL